MYSLSYPGATSISQGMRNWRDFYGASRGSVVALCPSVFPLMWTHVFASSFQIEEPAKYRSQGGVFKFRIDTFPQQSLLKARTAEVKLYMTLFSVVTPSRKSCPYVTSKTLCSLLSVHQCLFDDAEEPRGCPVRFMT